MLKFIEGMNILQKYFKDPAGYHIGADHDVIYVFKTDKSVSKEDKERLIALGWIKNRYDGWLFNV